MLSIHRIKTRVTSRENSKIKAQRIRIIMVWIAIPKQTTSFFIWMKQINENYIKDEIESLHKKLSELNILNKNVIDIDECVYLTGLKKQTLYKYTSECNSFGFPDTRRAKSTAGNQTTIEN